MGSVVEYLLRQDWCTLKVPAKSAVTTVLKTQPLTLPRVELLLRVRRSTTERVGHHIIRAIKDRAPLCPGRSECQLVPLEIVEWHSCRAYVSPEWPNSSATTRIFADVVISKGHGGRRGPRNARTVAREVETELFDVGNGVIVTGNGAATRRRMGEKKEAIST